MRGDISEDLIHDPAGNLLAQDNKIQQANIKGKHVNDNKADIAPMDLRNLTPENRKAVKDYVNTLPTDKQAKVIFIEE